MNTRVHAPSDVEITVPRFLNSERTAIEMLRRRAPHLGAGNRIILDFSNNLGFSDEALAVWLRHFAAHAVNSIEVHGAKHPELVTSLASWLVPHAEVRSREEVAAR